MKRWRYFKPILTAMVSSLTFGSHVVFGNIVNKNYFQSPYIGRVSWYGRARWLKTANMHIYNHNDLMAASRTLPFGTKVKVTNLFNHKSVVVTIVDRGPYVRGRVLDLFYGAAVRLGMINKGVVLAKIQVLPNHTKSHMEWLNRSSWFVATQQRMCSLYISNNLYTFTGKQTSLLTFANLIANNIKLFGEYAYAN